jgi:hypothetical protein
MDRDDFANICELLSADFEICGKGSRAFDYGLLNRVLLRLQHPGQTSF